MGDRPQTIWETAYQFEKMPFANRMEWVEELSPEVAALPRTATIADTRIISTAMLRATHEDKIEDGENTPRMRAQHRMGQYIRGLDQDELDLMLRHFNERRERRERMAEELRRQEAANRDRQLYGTQPRWHAAPPQDTPPATPSHQRAPSRSPSPYSGPQTEKRPSYDKTPQQPSDDEKMGEAEDVKERAEKESEKDSFDEDDFPMAEERDNDEVIKGEETKEDGKAQEKTETADKEHDSFDDSEVEFVQEVKTNSQRLAQFKKTVSSAERHARNLEMNARRFEKVKKAEKTSEWGEKATKRIDKDVETSDDDVKPSTFKRRKIAVLTSSEEDEKPIPSTAARPPTESAKKQHDNCPGCCSCCRERLQLMKRILVLEEELMDLKISKSDEPKSVKKEENEKQSEPTRTPKKANIKTPATATGSGVRRQWSPAEDKELIRLARAVLESNPRETLNSVPTAQMIVQREDSALDPSRTATAVQTRLSDLSRTTEAGRQLKKQYAKATTKND